MMIRCPKCGFEQPQEEYCAKCGVHIPSYYSSSPQGEQGFSKKSSTPLAYLAGTIALVTLGVSLWSFLSHKKSEQIRMRAANPPKDLRFIDPGIQVTPSGAQAEASPKEGEGNNHIPPTQQTLDSIASIKSHESPAPSKVLPPHEPEEQRLDTSLREESSQKAEFPHLELYWSHLSPAQIAEWLDKSEQEGFSPIRLQSLINIPLNQPQVLMIKKASSWELIQELQSSQYNKQTWIWPSGNKPDDNAGSTTSSEPPLTLQSGPLEDERGWGLAIWYQAAKDEMLQPLEFPFLKLEQTERITAYLIIPKFMKVLPDYTAQGEPKSYQSLLRYLRSNDFLDTEDEVAFLAILRHKSP
jgi:hypothetical protein